MNDENNNIQKLLLYSNIFPIEGRPRESVCGDDKGIVEVLLSMMGSEVGPARQVVPLHHFLSSLEACILSYFSEHPGSGNFSRIPGENALINMERGWSRLNSLRHDVRMPAFEHMVGCSPTVFQQISNIVAPYINLPKRISEGMFYGVPLQYLSVEEYEASYDVGNGATSVPTS